MLLCSHSTQPLWFQIVRESSATNAGLSFLPAFVTSTLGGFISGGLITKYGIVIPYFRVGWFIISLGTGLDALWSGAMPYWQQALLLAFSGTGFGMGMVCIMIIVQASVDGKDIGPATTFIGFLETMGGIIGLAILNVILAQEMTTKLPPRLYEIGDRYAVPRAMMDYASQAVLGGRPSDTLKPVQNFLIPGSPVYNETVEAMQSATNDAFKIIFIMVGVIGAIPLVLSIWLQKPNLSGGTLAVLDGERKPADEEVNLDQTISITSADVVENGVKADKL